jgi:hypothetical protein
MLMLMFFSFQCIVESMPSEENVAVENVDKVRDFLNQGSHLTRATLIQAAGST